MAGIQKDESSVTGWFMLSAHLASRLVYEVRLVVLRWHRATQPAGTCLYRRTRCCEMHYRGRFLNCSSWLSVQNINIAKGTTDPRVEFILPK